MPLSSVMRRASEHAVSALITAWSLVPATFRVQAYRVLSLLGGYIYEPSISRRVQRLPFGMYLKVLDAEEHEVLANEHGALQLARRYTHILIPRPLDLVTNGGHSYLLTSQIPGLRLGMCIDAMSDREVNSLVYDLQKCIRELREIPKSVAPDYMITNAVGKACFDYRIIAGSDYDEERGDLAGPFVDETEFNKKLQVGALPDGAHRIGHRIFFSHADLNMRNILIHNGRLSGIVDWESSGWYPEYWDYTNAYFITKLHKRWLGIIDRVIKPLGDYKSELAIERQIWEYYY
ncbi:protein kinase-like domain-containing protein [Fusarium bulbicola]|nr:protein kinase-like domain-containing protein [Fusarium bulbicola]